MGETRGADKLSFVVLRGRVGNRVIMYNTIQVEHCCDKVRRSTSARSTQNLLLLWNRIMLAGRTTAIGSRQQCSETALLLSADDTVRGLSQKRWNVTTPADGTGYHVLYNTENHRLVLVR